LQELFIQVIEGLQILFLNFKFKIFYFSYKAVRTKDVKEYVKWMMYWIVFALFHASEALADILLAFWFYF
jgi:hypothetical protein